MLLLPRASDSNFTQFQNSCRSHCGCQLAAMLSALPGGTLHLLHSSCRVSCAASIPASYTTPCVARGSSGWWRMLPPFRAPARSVRLSMQLKLGVTERSSKQPLSCEMFLDCCHEQIASCSLAGSPW